jgi:hypothetical protein
MDVAKIDRDVAYVASVSDKCCKRLFEIFHLFQTYVCKRFDLDVTYVSHIRCKSMFEMFHPYAAGSVFMLQVVSVYLEVTYVAMVIYMLQVYISNVSAVFKSMLQVFYLDVAYVASVCF